MAQEFGRTEQHSSRRGIVGFLTGFAALCLGSTAKAASVTEPGMAASPGSTTHPITTAEKAAGITPSNPDFAPLDVRRYGADSAGEVDCESAFASLFSVMLHCGGASAVIPPGRYKLGASVPVILTNSAPPNSTASGINLYAYGAVVVFSGTGYAFDFMSPNTSTNFYQPGLSIFGLNLKGTPRAAGGIRCNDLSMARFVDVFVSGFTAPTTALENGLGGTGITLRNTVSWSENCRFIGCGVVNCTTGMAFVNAGGSTSFARTSVEHFFGAAITNAWFDVGGGCAVYDSRFIHVSGNFGAQAYFAIGARGKDADMSSTLIDGIDAELNGALPGQAVLRLRNFPNGAGVARRPKVANIGLFAGYTGKGNIPVWSDGAGTPIAGPEPGQLQSHNIEGPLASAHGQSTFSEQKFNVGGAIRDAATTHAELVTCALSGCSLAVSGRLHCARSGNLVSLSAFDPLTGRASNVRTMTLTGITQEFWPSAERQVLCTVETDAGPTLAIAVVSTSGSISFSIATGTNIFSNTGFATSGTKGCGTGMTLSYPI